MGPERLRGDLRRHEDDLHPRPVHALGYAAAVRALAPDKAERKVWMERVKAQLNDGRVDLAVAGMKPHRERDEAVEACVRYMEANKDRMRCDACRSGPASWKAPASGSSGAGSSGRAAAGRRRAPTPCPPSNAASTTTAGSTSSIGGPAEPRPPDHKNGMHTFMLHL